MSIEAKIECLCGREAEKAMCGRCYADALEAEHDNALVGYVTEDYAEKEARNSVGSRVRDWADREKALGRLDAAQLALIERCAEDLEVG